MSRSQYWCFTLNNYNEEEVSSLQTLCTEEEVITYCIFGREVGEDAHTRHLQGYIELSRRLRLAQVKRLLGSRYHLEARRGTAAQASDYCAKDDESPFTYGEISTPSQGARSDLVALKSALDEKKPLSEISQEHFGQFLRYERSIKSYLALNQEKRTWEVDVKVYWGISRTGKTRRAYEEAGETLWVYPGKGWFDGYYGQDNVLFDDFYGDMPISLLLKVLDDWYPCSVPTKGGHVNWKPRAIWITSNTDPRDWYNGDSIPSDVKDALFNRLKTIEQFQ